MRVFSFLFCFALIALSCDKQEVIDEPNGDTNSESFCKDIIISNATFQDLAPDQASVNELSIDGDCLTVSISLSGCDLDHVINMISSGGIDESLPPQITFDFQDENPQDCEAYLTLDREYDLSMVKELVDTDIIIRFRNSDYSILYEK